MGSSKLRTDNKSGVRGFRITARTVKGRTYPYLVIKCRVPHTNSAQINRSLGLNGEKLIPALMDGIRIRAALGLPVPDLSEAEAILRPAVEAIVGHPAVAEIEISEQAQQNLFFYENLSSSDAKQELARLFGDDIKPPTPTPRAPTVASKIDILRRKREARDELLQMALDQGLSLDELQSLVKNA